MQNFWGRGSVASQLISMFPASLSESFHHTAGLISIHLLRKTGSTWSNRYQLVPNEEAHNAYFTVGLQLKCFICVIFILYQERSCKMSIQIILLLLMSIYRLTWRVQSEAYLSQEAICKTFDGQLSGRIRLYMGMICRDTPTLIDKANHIRYWLFCSSSNSLLSRGFQHISMSS